MEYLDSFVETAGAKIAVRVPRSIGDHVLLLINGHMRSKSDFKMLSQRLEADGWSCISFDNRGCGSTIADDRFTLQDMTDDAIAILDHYKVERAVILGISMGGMIAQNLASTYPARCLGLVLISTSSVGPDLNPSRLEWSSDIEVVRSKLGPYFSDEFRSKNQLLINAMIKNVADSLRDPAKVAGSKNQRRAIQGLDLSRLDRAIGVPTIVMHGTADMVLPFSEAERLIELISHAQLIRFEGAGHLLIAELGQTFYSRISDAISPWKQTT